MPGVADERRPTGSALEVREAERPGAAAEAEDPPRRLSYHHRGQRAGDRVRQRRWQAARRGKLLVFRFCILILMDESINARHLSGIIGFNCKLVP